MWLGAAKEDAKSLWQAQAWGFGGRGKAPTTGFFTYLSGDSSIYEVVHLLGISPQAGRRVSPTVDAFGRRRLQAIVHDGGEWRHQDDMGHWRLWLIRDDLSQMAKGQLRGMGTQNNNVADDEFDKD